MFVFHFKPQAYNTPVESAYLTVDLVQNSLSNAWLRTFIWPGIFFINTDLQAFCGEGNGNPLKYSCLENPMDGGAWQATVHGVTRHWTRLSDFTFLHWRRKWQPTPVFLPGESQGWGSLVGCCLWGRTESDTTEATQQQQLWPCE